MIVLSEVRNMDIDEEKIFLWLRCFSVSFTLIMLLFLKKPDILESKNKFIRTVMLFCVAFVPGVMSASICAKILTAFLSHIRKNGKIAVTDVYFDNFVYDEYCV